jgi:hypothetical protein
MSPNIKKFDKQVLYPDKQMREEVREEASSGLGGKP